MLACDEYVICMFAPLSNTVELVEPVYTVLFWIECVVDVGRKN